MCMHMACMRGSTNSTPSGICVTCLLMPDTFVPYHHHIKLTLPSASTKLPLICQICCLLSICPPLCTGKPRGFAFLAYDDQRSTVLAVDNLSGAKVAGRIVTVNHVDNYKVKRAEVCHELDLARMNPAHYNMRSFVITHIYGADMIHD